jgi:hypothetical protein
MALVCGASCPWTVRDGISATVRGRIPSTVIVTSGISVMVTAAVIALFERAFVLKLIGSMVLVISLFAKIRWRPWLRV